MPILFTEIGQIADYERRFSHVNEIRWEEFEKKPQTGWYHITGGAKDYKGSIYREADYPNIADRYTPIIRIEQSMQLRIARKNMDFIQKRISLPFAPGFLASAPNSQAAANGLVLLVHTTPQLIANENALRMVDPSSLDTVEGVVHEGQEMPLSLVRYFSDANTPSSTIHFMVLEDRGTPKTFPPSDIPRPIRVLVVVLGILLSVVMAIYQQARRADMMASTKTRSYANAIPVSHSRPIPPHDTQTEPLVTSEQPEVELLPLPISESREDNSA